MEYSDLNNIVGLKEREEFLKEYYKFIGIESWMVCNKIQHIKFKDSIQKLKNGKLHSIDSPALIKKDIVEYYFNGEKITKEKFNRILRIKKIDRLMKNRNL